ncbi:MAG: TRAP transporter small permease [Rhodospirillaceae bacterium]
MKALRKLYDFVVIGLAAVSGIILMLMFVLIIADVSLRNLGFQPLRATVAITEYALLYFTMFAAPYLVRTRGHVVVRIIYDRLDNTAKIFLENVIYILCAGAALLIAYVSGNLVIESLILGDTEPRSIDLPRWILFTPLLIGFFFVGCEFLRFLFTKESFYDPPDDTAHTQERY